MAHVYQSNITPDDSLQCNYHLDEYIINEFHLVITTIELCQKSNKSHICRSKLRGGV
jgi:hypothetical protein